MGELGKEAVPEAGGIERPARGSRAGPEAARIGRVLSAAIIWFVAHALASLAASLLVARSIWGEEHAFHGGLDHMAQAWTWLALPFLGSWVYVTGAHASSGEGDGTAMSAGLILWQVVVLGLAGLGAVMLAN